MEGLLWIQVSAANHKFLLLAGISFCWPISSHIQVTSQCHAALISARFFSVAWAAPEAGIAAGLLAALELCKTRKVRLEPRENSRLKVNSCRNSKLGRKNEALPFFVQLVKSSKFKTLFLCKTHLFGTSFYFVTLNEIHGRRHRRAKRTKMFCLKTHFL